MLPHAQTFPSVFNKTVCSAPSNFAFTLSSASLVTSTKAVFVSKFASSLIVILLLPCFRAVISPCSFICATSGFCDENLTFPKLSFSFS